MTNAIMREKFNQWYIENGQPVITEIAKEIGMNRSAVSNWMRDKEDFGDKRLNRIKVFLGEEVKSVRELNEEQKQKLKENDMELLTEYTGVSNPGTVKCLKCSEEISSPQVHYLISGRKKCKSCKASKPYVKRTMESYIEEIKEKNLTILEDYQGIKKSIQHKCLVCEYIWPVQPNSIVNVNTGCPTCSGQTPWTIERYEAFVESIEGYKLIEKRETNTTGKLMKLQILHEECGLIWSPSVNRFQQGSRCPNCSKNIWTNKKLKEAIEAEPGYKLIDKREPETKYDKLEVFHEVCGKSWSPAIISFVHHGSRCPNCRFSRGEKMVNDALDKYEVESSTQYKFPDCIFKSPLPFDSAVLKNNRLVALIEYDGLQHFESVEHWGGEETFKLQQLKDKIKDVYCATNHIPLLRIGYLETEAMTEALVYSHLAMIDAIDESAQWEEYYQQEEGKSYSVSLGLPESF